MAKIFWIVGLISLVADQVTGEFDAARAGAFVWVQTLDGGVLQAVDNDGQVVTADGGFLMELDAAGKVNFNFQAPTASNRFQVLIRLDDVITILPFEVPSATADAEAPAPIAAPVAAH